MPLLVTRRNLGHCSLVNLTHAGEGGVVTIATLERVLLEPSVVEPDVVVSRLVRELLLILDATLAEDGGLDAGSVAELLLKVRVGGVELGGTGSGEVLEGELDGGGV